ncbi:MAG: DUF6794 domain-containing protein [Acidiferrobacterales bacterium]
MGVATLTLWLAVAGQTSQADLHRDAFLRPYVAEMRRETPRDNLDRIAEASFDELVRFHMGYGGWIRNRWLWGERDPALMAFFRKRGVRHPDTMSHVLIQALWEELNADLTPAERRRVMEKRRVVAAKRASYEQLEDECAGQLAGTKGDFEHCYADHGPPTTNPHNRKPFSKLMVGRDGSVKRVVYFDGASQPLRQCLDPLLAKYRFSAFEHDEQVTLYILGTPPRCRVWERDRL